MKSEIFNLNLDAIEAHPEQQNIYGEPKVSGDFVDDIRARGVLEPVIVTTSFGPVSALKSATLIAGHRRLAAAKEAGLETIPAIFREYGSIGESLGDLIASNNQRDKTKANIAAEIMHYKQNICQIAQARMKAGVSADATSEKETLSSEEERVHTSKNIAEVTGRSHAYIDKVIALCDSEHYGKWGMAFIRAGGTEAKLEKVKIIWDRLRESYLHDPDYTLTGTYGELMALKKAAEAAIGKKPKKLKPPPKPKPPKPKHNGAFQLIPAEELPNIHARASMCKNGASVAVIEDSICIIPGEATHGYKVDVDSIIKEAEKACPI